MFYTPCYFTLFSFLPQLYLECPNLLDQPEVSVEGDDSYTVLKYVSSNTLFVGKTSEDQNLIQAMIQDTETTAAYPAQDATLAEVASVSITESDWYSRISALENYWLTDHSESNFSNQSVTNLIQQSENTALAYVTMDYYATNGEVESRFKKTKYKPAVGRCITLGT